MRVLREVGVAIGGPIGAGKDDDALHHQMIPKALRLHDFGVHLAKTETDGLGVLKSTQADLFLLDADDPRPLMTALESVSEPVS